MKMSSDVSISMFRHLLAQLTVSNLAGASLKRCRPIQETLVRHEDMGDYFTRYNTARVCETHEYSRDREPPTQPEYGTLYQVAKDLDKEAAKRQRMKEKFQRRKARLQAVDASNNSNYYERYIRKKSLIRERRVLADSVSHARDPLCSIL